MVSGLRVNRVAAETSVGRVDLDPAVGNIQYLAFSVAGRTITPLHTAHWVGGPVPAHFPPVDANLAGDFLCAPFGASDVIGGPHHGPTANSAWTLTDNSSGSLTLRLDDDVMGARVTKTVRLSDDAPVLMQCHLIEGGRGQLTAAHHPMVRLNGRGWMSVSTKSAGLTPDDPLEPGRNRLACGQLFSDLRACPGEGGGTVDLTQLPIANTHEDFVTLIEAPGAAVGWTAIIREDEDDLIFILKDPAVLPVTMVWHSNGGRDHAPWDGRHTGVVGVEDGCAAGAAGHRAALGANPISAQGVATTITLGGTVRIAHVMGAIPRPKGWKRVAEVDTADGRLTLTERGGGTIGIPFDDGFLSGAGR